MNLRSITRRLHFIPLASVLTLAACKTSGEVARGGYEDDPSGVVTVEDLPPPAQTTPNSLPPVTPVGGTHSASGTDTGPNAQELAILRGRLEDNQVMAQRERDALAAKIAELEAQNRALQEEVARRGSAPATPIAGGSAGDKGAAGAVALWQSAQIDMKSGNFEKAIAPLNEIAKSYPKHELAMPALLNVGILQYQTGNYNDAALTFNTAIEKFGKRKEVALAWYGQAASFSKLKQADESKLVFEEVVSRFPTSNEAKSAKLIISKKDRVPNSLFSLASKHRSLRL